MPLIKTYILKFKRQINSVDIIKKKQEHKQMKTQIVDKKCIGTAAKDLGTSRKLTNKVQA